MKRVRMKFFERTFLLTLLLFLLFLNGGVFALAVYTHSNSVAAAEQVCRSEEYYISQTFAQDLAATGESGKVRLQETYVSFYRQKEVYLQFASGGEIVCSALPDGIKKPLDGTLLNSRTDGKRYMVISRALENGGISVTYAKEVTYLDEEFLRLSVVFVVTSLVASALLAVFLYLLLRKLYAPLGQLSKASAGIANGDFSVRADDSGTDEFSALARDFNAMSEKICNQMEELRATADQRQRMLDNLAHEMRTPLTGIHGYAEYICAARVSEEEKIDAAQLIMSESMRLKHVSEILLDIAFVRENKIHPTELVAREMLLHTRDRLYMRAQEKEVTLSCVGGEFLLNGDKVLLELMLANLAENALKACKQGGVVELGATDEDGKKTLYVKDDGAGMTEEQLAHITEPFYRTDKARARRDGGTGLGLALCEQVALAHGATLSFASTLGEGTTAFVTFAKEADS